MAIKIYETKIRPTDTTAEAMSTPGMKISQATAMQIGESIKGAGRSAVNLYAEIETRKSENEVLEKKKKILTGDDTFEGLSMAREKASQMDDPDMAVKYYNEAVQKAKNALGDTYNHRFSKKLFDQYLSKQEIQDGIVVRSNSNKQFLAKSQSLESEEIERLKKDIVYGETEQIKQLAKQDLAKKFEDSKFNNLFGALGTKLKTQTYADIEFYNAKRAIDVNATEGLAQAKKNKLISVDAYEKLRTYAKTSSTKTKEANGNKIDEMQKGVKDYILPNVEEIKTAEATAIATNDTKSLEKISNIKKTMSVVANLKTMDKAELDAALSSTRTIAKEDMVSGRGTDVEDLFRMNIIRDYHAKITSDLEKDPISTAAKIGTFDSKDLPLKDLFNGMKDEQEFSNEVSERIATAKSVGKFYNQKTKFFTESEQQQLKDFFENTTDPQRLINVSKSLVKAFGANSDQVFKEIGKSNDFFGYIGGLSVVNGTTSTAVQDAMLGHALKNSKAITKTFSLTDAGYQNFLKDKRDAFPRSEKTFNAVTEAANNIYLAQMYKNGKDTTNFNRTEYGKAFDLATGKVGDYGGLEKYKGNNIVLPNFVKNGKFNTVVELLKDKDIFLKATGGATAKALPNAQGEQRDIDPFKEGEPVFISVGNGKYIMSLKDHPFAKNATPAYIMSSKPNIETLGPSFLIVDLNKIKTEILERK